MSSVHGKGGARHFTKPHIDVGILKRELDKHKLLIQNLGAYESVSRNQAANPKGLIGVIDLVAGLLVLEPSCEVHQASLRSALMAMYTEDPNINNTRYNGAVWVGMRIERINVILYHFRRLRNADDMRVCASRLTSPELLRLQKVVEDIDKKEPPATLDKRDDGSTESAPSKRLKKEVSEVSMDSEGYPRCFKTPQTKEEQPLPKGEGAEASKPKEEQPLPKGDAETSNAMQPSFMRRRLGQALPVVDNDEDFKKDMGLIAKRPAGKGKKKKDKKGIEKKPATLDKRAGAFEASSFGGTRKPWVKLKKTRGKKPERAYITGTTEVGNPKLKLVVEIRKSRSERYDEHIDTIMGQLKKKHLTKQEALDLRGRLCSQD